NKVTVADDLGLLSERDAAVTDGLIQALDGGKAAVGERFIDKGPKMFGRLELDEGEGLARDLQPRRLTIRRASNLRFRTRTISSATGTPPRACSIRTTVMSLDHGRFRSPARAGYRAYRARSERLHPRRPVGRAFLRVAQLLAHRPQARP